MCQELNICTFTGKVFHRHRCQAEHAVKVMRRRDHGTKAPRQSMNIFRCHHCGHWHLGHAMTEVLTDKDVFPKRRRPRQKVVALLTPDP